MREYICGLSTILVNSVSSGAWVTAIPLVTVLALVLLWNSDAFSILRKGGD